MPLSFETLVWWLLAGVSASVVLSLLALLRASHGFAALAQELREELRAGRAESRGTGRELREEIGAGLRQTGETFFHQLDSLGQMQRGQLDDMARQFAGFAAASRQAQDGTRNTLDLRVRELQEGNERRLVEVRQELAEGLRGIQTMLTQNLRQLGEAQTRQLETMNQQLAGLIESNRASLEGIRGTFDQRLRESHEGNVRLMEANRATLEGMRNTLDGRVKELQEGNERKVGEMRQEIGAGLKAGNDALTATLRQLGDVQRQQLEALNGQLVTLVESNRNALDGIRTTFDARIRQLQEGNERKLEEMRRTVDEKLHDTLEKRLGDSFKIVSDRLEAVHKGLGEMQHLATGVGDLKRVLTNVKARGTWAEVQLGAILEQVLTPEQYGRNVAVVSDASERVEFAIRLPGPRDDPARCVWLPIDSKFPQEDYLRLQEAAERADTEGVQTALDALGRTVKGAALDIHDKYIRPPDTTDFGIMFLATEGLYAEVLRQPELVDELQQRWRVVVAGPTTLVAILNSLRMGFQTLAIEQRTSEVWRILGATKTEFGKFGDVLDKVRKQLATVSRTIESTEVRSRAIERRLRSVERLPEDEADNLLALPLAGMAEDTDDETGPERE